jgi:hypothetical protein
MAESSGECGARVSSNETMRRATKNEDHAGAADKIVLVDLIGVELTTSSVA